MSKTPHNVVLVSHVQQNDSVIYIHVSILFQILFPFRLLQNTEQICPVLYSRLAIGFKIFNIHKEFKNLCFLY